MKVILNTQKLLLILLAKQLAKKQKMLTRKLKLTKLSDSIKDKNF
jgi:hypothetical protein